MMAQKGANVMATILLIHGAYQGGWIWNRVAAALRAKGHHVLAPSLDGCAERAAGNRPGITTESHAEELARLLFMEDLQEVTACGTSTGGMVLCRLAELAPDRLGRLVFADALVRVGTDGLHKWTAGVKSEPASAADFCTFGRLKARAHLRTASHTGRQVVFEFKSPGPVRHPAA
jgi:pimeloyl-ACP methyl ester carboxylesterase